KKDMLVFDDEQRGLAVRVTKKAKYGSLDGKSYPCQYTFNGRKRRIALGSCASISLVKAREAARAIMGDVAKGIDPAVERKKAKAHESLTLDALLSDWQALHLAAKRPRYAAEATRALRKAFAPYLDLPAAHLGRTAIVKTLDAMTRK